MLGPWRISNTRPKGTFHEVFIEQLESLPLIRNGDLQTWND
jgi:hypothetical protein